MSLFIYDLCISCRDKSKMSALKKCEMQGFFTVWGPGTQSLCIFKCHLYLARGVTRGHGGEQIFYRRSVLANCMLKKMKHILFLCWTISRQHQQSTLGWCSYCWKHLGHTVASKYPTYRAAINPASASTAQICIDLILIFLSRIPPRATLNQWHTPLNWLTMPSSPWNTERTECGLVVHCDGSPNSSAFHDSAHRILILCRNETEQRKR